MVDGSAEVRVREKLNRETLLAPRRSHRYCSGWLVSSVGAGAGDSAS